MNTPARSVGLRLLFVLVVSHLLAPPAAHAYIDPLSGSVLLQALIAGVLGAIVSIKQVGTAVRLFFARIRTRLFG
jgi:hypothetical protein